MGCDRISELPESLLTEILLNLPTKDSVKTSVLSTRWRNLWLYVPGLDLKIIDFPLNGQVFASFVDNFLKFNHKSTLQKFKILIKYDEVNDRKRLVELIGTMVDHGVQHLDVGFHYISTFNIYDVMPHNIYKSPTLVSLKLVSVGIKNPEFVVSLPYLKIMHLEDIRYEDDDPLIIEKFISGCPVLEDLTVIIGCNHEQVMWFLGVRSPSLKRFCFSFGNRMGSTNVSVEIDAPRLDYMSFRNNLTIVVKNLSSLVKINIDTEFNLKHGHDIRLAPEVLSKRDIIRDFLTDISGVKHMIISPPTLDMLYRYSKLGPIPNFDNLSHLQAAFSSLSFQLLPAFLESCPNLKNLIIMIKDFCSSTKLKPINFTNVPRCLISTLEYVDINELFRKDEIGIKLVNYFLENSAVLKKLTLSFTYTFITKQESESNKKLLTSTKLSRTCKIAID